MGKYGKPVEINLDILSYNIGLIGSSGVGKSSLIKEVCEILAGKDGYIMLDLGKEMGHDAISGIISEKIEDWEKLEDVIEDIVDNKSTDYPNLKVVVFDTIDQLFEIAEKECIRQYNRTVPIEKKADTINSAWSGYGKGLDKTIDLVLNKMWELKKVGVSFIVVGHVKQREQTDIETEMTYRSLTTDISQKYFNAIKNKLHVLGVASIDREIIAEKTGKKNLVTKKDEMKNVIKSESRKITFRDDNYAIDSKSRFANIVDSIPLDANEFIKALKNAIISEHSKGDKSLEQTQKEQQEARIIKDKDIAEKSQQDKESKSIKAKVDKVMQFIKDNKNNKEIIGKIMSQTKSLGFRLPSDIDTIDGIETIIKIIEE